MLRMVEIKPLANPFRELKPIVPARKLLEQAKLRAIRSSPVGISDRVHPLVRVKRVEEHRLLKFETYLEDKLDEIVRSFPQLDDEGLHPFYLEMLQIIVPLDEMKKILGSILGTLRVIRQIRREYVRKIRYANRRSEAKHYRFQAVGRISSLIRQLSTRLEMLESIRRQLKRLPNIDPNLPTLCLAGYPNTGKSSFVRNVTRARVKIGEYPFTTEEVHIGHCEIDIGQLYGYPISFELPWQIVDTPGILDRPLEARKAIELRALAAIESLASVILYLFDGALIEIKSVREEQINLFKHIKKILPDIPIMWAISKEDLVKERGNLAELQNILENELSSSGLTIQTNNPISCETALKKIVKHSKVRRLVENRFLKIAESSSSM